MLFQKSLGRGLLCLGLLVSGLTVGAGPQVHAAGKPAITVLTPADGATITSTAIPVKLDVSNFKLAGPDAGLPDQPGEGHIHVMLDGMNMGVLFNFYSTSEFSLPGQAIRPGEHTLIFDLASNTHKDMEDTVQQVKINYQPATPEPAPAAAAPTGPATVAISAPADGATVGPQFTLEVQPTNFTPSLGLEGKANLAGYGHYHVFVDMAMSGSMGGEMGGTQGGMSMMSMAGMVGMPGSNTIQLDLRAWANGKHTIVVEQVQNDHTPLKDAKAAMITINLTGSSGTGMMGGTMSGGEQMGGTMSGNTMPKTGNGDTVLLMSGLAGVALLLAGGGLALRRRRA